jgi:hypothetical protein
VDNGDGRIGAVGIRKGAAVGVRFWSVSLDEEDDPLVGGRMVNEIGVDMAEEQEGPCSRLQLARVTGDAIDYGQYPSTSVRSVPKSIISNR